MTYRDRLMQLVCLTSTHKEVHTHISLAHAMASQAIVEYDKRDPSRTVRFVRKCKSSLQNYVATCASTSCAEGITRALAHASALSSTTAFMYLRWSWRCRALAMHWSLSGPQTVTIS